MPFTKASAIKAKLKALVFVVFGEQKTGKDYFCLQETPGPISLLNLDQGLVGLDRSIKGFGEKVRVGGLPGGKGNYPSYCMPIIPKDLGLENVTRIAMPIWTAFLTDYQAALRDDSRTVVVDTSGAAYDLALCAYVGSSAKVSPKDDPFQKKATAAKRLFRSLGTSAMDSGKNVIFIARANQVWEDGEPVKGKWKPEGWNGLPYEVMFSLFLSKTEWRGNTIRKATIQDSRLEGDVMDGTVFEGKDVNFPNVAATVSGMPASYWRG